MSLRTGEGNQPPATAASRRRLLHRLGAVATLGLAGGAPAACSDRRAAPTSTGAGRVEFWQLYQSSPAAPQLKELFARKRPNVQVEWVDVPAGEQPGKLTVAAAGGTPPDLSSITAPFFGDTS